VVKRITLTKAQLALSETERLVELCLKLVDDGVLVHDEVVELKQFLSSVYRDDVAAFGFLNDLVDDVLADGVVDDMEARELYKAIERVLPKSQREVVKNRRLAVDEVVKKQRADKKIESFSEGFDSEPVLFDFMVAGCKYENRPSVVKRYARQDVEVLLARDKRNKFSPNAIEVRIKSNGKVLGYVPEYEAVDMAPLLDSGFVASAFIKKMLYRSDPPTPVIVSVLSEGKGEGRGSVYNALLYVFKALGVVTVAGFLLFLFL